MREPGIHISKTTFKYIIDKLELDIDDDLVDLFFKEARNFSLDHRSVLSTNSKTRISVEKRVSSSINEANLLSDIIYAVRIKMKHISVFKIKQIYNQWAQIKSLVPTVNSFCEKYGFKQREGYIKFVETGLKILSTTKRANYNYCASWMLQKVDWILNKFESDKLLAEDEFPEETTKMHDIYVSLIAEKTGIWNNYKGDPLQYVNFYWAKQLANQLNVDYETFIEAQFNALDFCNGIPKLEDLGNDKAKQRLTQYLSKNGLEVKEESKMVSDDVWKDFKK